MSARVRVGHGATVLAEPDDTHRLGALRLAPGSTGRIDDAVGWLTVETGDGDLSVDGVRVAVRGRGSVFERAEWSAFLAPGAEFALAGALSATLVWRGHRGAAPASRLVDPSDVAEEVRGEGSTARTVRTYLPDGPMVCGETLNPPGGWSSYPPHRHEAEEVYLYRFDPPTGFGVAACYDEDGAGSARPQLLRDGDLTRITGGYHPVVAAPDAAMYYLWVLAEPPTTLLDPVFG